MAREHPDYQSITEAVREHPDYEPFTVAVKQEIRDMRKIYPDFSPKGMKIDDLLDEDYIHRFDPFTVILVAMEQGFYIKTCTQGRLHRCHSNPVMQANGLWLEVPQEFNDAFDPRRNYQEIGDFTRCPACESKLLKQAEVTGQILEKRDYPVTLPKAAALKLPEKIRRLREEEEERRFYSESGPYLM